jgi:hypothetical protein
MELCICNKILRRTTKLRKQYMGFLARTGLFIYELYKAVINVGSFLVEILLNGSTSEATISDNFCRRRGQREPSFALAVKSF